MFCLSVLEARDSSSQPLVTFSTANLLQKRRKEMSEQRSGLVLKQEDFSESV